MIQEITILTDKEKEAASLQKQQETLEQKSEQARSKLTELNEQVQAAQLDKQTLITQLAEKKLSCQQSIRRKNKLRPN